MENKLPLVSVVMPVYNARLFVADAIESILSQTYQNFELVIVDDHSKDNSREIIESYQKRYPNKIRVIYLPKTLDKSGDCATNTAIKQARGTYIAKMDADDIASPLRLEKQVEFLEAHKDIFLVGTQAYVIDRDGNNIGEKHNPTTHNEIYNQYFLYNCIIHPSIMFRSEGQKEQFYDIAFPCFNEYWTFFKYMTEGKKFANLEEPLLFYRLHGKNDTFTHIKKKFMSTLSIKKSFIAKLGYKPSFKQVIVTILQSIVVFSMPEKALLFVYLLCRNVISYQSILQNIKLNKLQSIPLFQTNN